MKKPPKISRKLKFWIDHTVSGQASGHERIKLITDELAEYEAAGQAMRYLDQSGEIAWRPTRQMLERLAEQELEARDELDEDF